MRQRGVISGVILAVAAACVMTAATAATPGSPDIVTSDVDLFYKIYDAAGGHPSADQLQHDYLDKGSEGLHVLARMRNVTGARIAETLGRRPQIYASAKKCMAVLPRVKARLELDFHKLDELYPQAIFPPVTIAVGRGNPVGIGSPLTGVQIGLEALCATGWMNPEIEERFVHTIAHEYVHVQQPHALVDDEHPTVLEASIIEGAAEFVGELISGAPAYTYFGPLTKGREKEIETAFTADEDKTNLSHWLYNSTPGKPADLGYWVGYRICKSYYEHTSDKRAAVRDIIQMTDPRAFLARSGWYPGIRL